MNPQELINKYGGRFSSSLGIRLSASNPDEIFKWFIASMLFGARISGNIAIKTYNELISKNIASPEDILKIGWDGLVAILDEGGYARYDFKTATKFLEVCKSLTENYNGNLNILHSRASDWKDLENRLKVLGKGIGDVTVNIFLRELRGIWLKATPLPPNIVMTAAKKAGFIPEELTDNKKALHMLLSVWNGGRKGQEAEKRLESFPDFESALVKSGLEIRKKKLS